MFWKTEDGEVDKRCLFLVLLLTGAIVAGGLYICSPFFDGSGEEVPAEESIREYTKSPRGVMYMM